MTTLGHECRYCGCTEYNACTFERDGVTVNCWWIDRERNVCSSPTCVKRYQSDLKAKTAEIRKLVNAMRERAA